MHWYQSMMSSDETWHVSLRTRDSEDTWHVILRMVKAVPPLEHNDSNTSILSYGTEDLAQYPGPSHLPQATTRIVLGCAGAASSNPYIDTAAGYQVGGLQHCSIMH